MQKTPQFQDPQLDKLFDDWGKAVKDKEARGERRKTNTPEPPRRRQTTMPVRDPYSGHSKQQVDQARHNVNKRYNPGNE